MMMPSVINMTRPNLMYSGGVVFLLVLSLLISNIPELSLSHYILIPNKRLICLSLFFISSLFALFAFLKFIARSKEPWKVPQSQVSYLYLMFFVLALVALILAK